MMTPTKPAIATSPTESFDADIDLSDDQATSTPMIMAPPAARPMSTPPPPPRRAPLMPAVEEGVLDQAKHAAQTLMGQTREEIGNQLLSRKDEVVDRAHTVAGVIREAGEKLGDDDGGLMTDYASQAADQVERLSSYVRSRNIGELIQDAHDFARKEPAMFVGGSFALGLFAARFLKSSAHDTAPPTAKGTTPAKPEGAT